MRGLAGIARDFDRGFGHLTTRQNIQFNWIKLVEAPDILDRLAGLEMHDPDIGELHPQCHRRSAGGGRA